MRGEDCREFVYIDPVCEKDQKTSLLSVRVRVRYDH